MDVSWPRVAATTASARLGQVLSVPGSVACAMAGVVAPKAAKAIRRRLRRRPSQPVEVEFCRVLMARGGAAREFQRLQATTVDGQEALRVSTSQGKSAGAWLHRMLTAPGDGIRSFDGAINNFLQDCRAALRTTKATAADDHGAEPRDPPGSSQDAEFLESQEPSTTGGAQGSGQEEGVRPSPKRGRDYFLADSDEEVQEKAPSQAPEVATRSGAQGRKGRPSAAGETTSFEKKHPAPAGWTTLHVRARDMLLHFDTWETMHIPATKECVDALLTELTPRKGERRRKKAQHSCAHAFRSLLKEVDHGKVQWRSYSWEVHWEAVDGTCKKTVAGFRVRDTGEPTRDKAAARRALERARRSWNDLDRSTGARIPHSLLANSQA